MGTKEECRGSMRVGSGGGAAPPVGVWVRVAALGLGLAWVLGVFASAPSHAAGVGGWGGAPASLGGIRSVPTRPPIGLPHSPAQFQALRNRLNMVPPSPASASSGLSLILGGAQKAAPAQRNWEVGMGLTTRAIGAVGQAEEARQAGNLSAYRLHLSRALALERGAVEAFREASAKDFSLMDQQYRDLRTVKETALFTGDVVSKFGGPTVAKAWEEAKLGINLIDRSGERGLDILSPGTWRLDPLLAGTGDVLLQKTIERALRWGNPDLPHLQGRPIIHGETLLHQPWDRVGHALLLSAMEKRNSVMAAGLLDVLGRPVLFPPPGLCPGAPTCLGLGTYGPLQFSLR